MHTSRVQFARQYRAAMFDYLLERGEEGRDRAYLLGRRAVAEGVGLLRVVSIHHEALMTIVGVTRAIADVIGDLEAAHEFLLETLAAFDVTSRGYVDLAGRKRT